MTTNVARPFSVLFSTAVAAFALGGCDVAPERSGTASDALNEDDCPESVPAALTPDADQNLAWIIDAEGVQIYSCNATASGHAWTFVAPRADLFNDGGDVIGTHYAGPTWEANDGSTVVAARKAGASVDPSAIPWLSLTAKSHNDVDGRFSDVSSLQRLETVGGNAPATGCDAEHAGAIVEVPYAASYAMYKTKASGPVHQCAD